MQHGNRGLNIHEGGSHRTQMQRDNTSEDNYSAQTDTNGTMQSNAVMGHVADTACDVAHLACDDALSAGDRREMGERDSDFIYHLSYCLNTG